MDCPNPDDANKLGSTRAPVAGEAPVLRGYPLRKPPIIGNAGQLVVASVKESLKKPADTAPDSYEYFRGILVGEVGPYVVIETPFGAKTLQRCDYDFFVKSE